MRTSKPAPATARVERADETVRRAETALLASVDRLGHLEKLDPLITGMRRLVHALPLGRSRDVLHGRPLGHPLHPILVQIPTGSWLSAAVLDAVPGGGRHARLLVGLGVVSALPAALAGWVDWAEQHEEQGRVGLVHALANGAAIGLYTASWVARGRRRPVLGRALGLAGLGALGLGGALGGHLAYRQAAGANKAEPVSHVMDPGWQTLGRMEEFPVGEAVRRLVGEVALLVVREAGGHINVLADRCSHDSGPLSQGTLADGCVTCPWHGSVFRLSDGWNVRGPATSPQPSFETRTADDGTVEVRAPQAH
ncbi:Rieske 2Fe-2S domain-containing protein [Streptomyces sp. NPDC087420]|uniref:Rieske 2Fe-2S domain-containing protein n=1 Tax=Streptomyces sp. NPDC087420 TaxID=3365785 RepID=UPI003839AE53